MSKQGPRHVSWRWANSGAHVSHSPTHCSTQGLLFLKTTSFQASLRKQVSSNLLGTSGSKSPLKISKLVPLKGKGRVCLSEGFSALALAVCGAREFFVAGSCPVHYGMLKGILGLYPRDARSTSLHDNRKCLQTLPKVSRVAKYSPDREIENYALFHKGILENIEKSRIRSLLGFSCQDQSLLLCDT